MYWFLNEFGPMARMAQSNRQMMLTDPIVHHNFHHFFEVSFSRSESAGDSVASVSVWPLCKFEVVRHSTLRGCHSYLSMIARTRS